MSFVDPVGAEAPADRMDDAPTAHPLAVEVELRGEPVDAPPDPRGRSGIVEQERVSLGVVREQAAGSPAVVVRQRLGLPGTLVVGEADLQDRAASRPRAGPARRTRGRRLRTWAGKTTIAGC